MSVVPRRVSLTLENLRKYGWHSTYVRVRKYLIRRHQGRKLARRMLLTPEERAAQEAETFEPALLFSVISPLYNTPLPFLREMVESVLGQTYRRVELCLADGSDAAHAGVEAVCRAYAARDPRVKYVKLPQNLGIVGNSNAAVEMATGDYLALLDHDDLLHPSALYHARKAIADTGADFLYTDEVTIEKDVRKPVLFHCKPDFGPDNLRANNYICHLSIFSRELLDRAGGPFRAAYEGSQDYDLILRLTENARVIRHIPEVLYYWRSHGGSVASDISAKPYCVAAAKRALGDHFARQGLRAEAVDAPMLTSLYKINYQIEGTPLVSLLVPSRDHAADLRRCLSSLLEKTTWPRFEILVLENGSTAPETFAYYGEIAKDPRIRVETYPGEDFNFSALQNFGAARARGEYLLLLNNDTQVIHGDFLTELLMYAQRPDVGAVGAKLFYPNDTVQHAGIAIGINGTAGHLHHKAWKGDLGHMGNLYYAHNVSAVTAACLLVRKAVFEEAGGFDEAFAVAFGDVDFCLRLRERGYLNVFTPFATLYHHESSTRGSDKIRQNAERFRQESDLFRQKWKAALDQGDPYYNPHFRLDTSDFLLGPSLRSSPSTQSRKPRTAKEKHPPSPS